MLNQEQLRTNAKLVKAIEDINYKDQAGVIDLQEHSFYNWLNGYYDLSETKAKELEAFLNDLLY